MNEANATSEMHKVPNRYIANRIIDIGQFIIK